MWGSNYTHRGRCFICDGTGAIYLCKNPFKNSIISKDNDKKLKKGLPIKIPPGNLKTVCPQCSGQGFIEIDVDTDDYKKRIK